jgi:tetratricopeptide (TPR) repeat protein
MNGELDKAIKDFTDSIQLDNSVASIFLLRSHAYSLNNEIQNALADTNEALRLQSDDAIAYKARGNLLAYEGNHYEALLDFQKACALEPNNGSARVSLAKALRFLNRLDEAQEEARIARELIQNENEYEYELACLEVVFENTSRALELLKIALEKNQVAKEWVRQDPDFESIRHDPRFKELVGD